MLTIMCYLWTKVFEPHVPVRMKASVQVGPCVVFRCFSQTSADVQAPAIAFLQAGTVIEARH